VSAEFVKKDPMAANGLENALNRLYRIHPTAKSTKMGQRRVMRQSHNCFTGILRALRVFPPLKAAV
jgi:hypothetical protein